MKALHTRQDFLSSSPVPMYALIYKGQYAPENTVPISDLISFCTGGRVSRRGECVGWESAAESSSDRNLVHRVRGRDCAELQCHGHVFTDTAFYRARYWE